MSRRLPLLAGVAVLIAVGAQSAVYATHPHVGGEGGVLDWISVAFTAAAAAAAAALAVTARLPRGRLVLLAGAVGYLAVDDALGLHERISTDTASELGVSGRGDVLFLLPYLPLLAFALWAVWAVARASAPSVRRVLDGGIALLVLSMAFRVAAAGALLLGADPAHWERTAGGALIHDAELAAWLAITLGLVAAQTATTSASTPSAASARWISST